MSHQEHEQEQAKERPSALDDLRAQDLREHSQLKLTLAQDNGWISVYDDRMLNREHPFVPYLKKFYARGSGGCQQTLPHIDQVPVFLGRMNSTLHSAQSDARAVDEAVLKAYACDKLMGVTWELPCNSLAQTKAWQTWLDGESDSCSAQGDEKSNPTEELPHAVK